MPPTASLKRPRVKPSAPPVGSSYLDTTGTFVTLDLGLDPRLIKAVARLNYVHPTLVQRQAIPLALTGKDLLVRAKTGSGKTAAYGLVVLQKLLDARGSGNDSGPTGGSGGGGARVFAVVLVPTRDLVEQTAAALADLAYYCTDCARVVGLGGGSMAEQAAAIARGADVLVGTPAKLLAHLRAGSLSAQELRASVGVLVVDEADLVLTYGGGDDVKAVVAALPRITHTLLVSATLSTQLEDLKRLVLHNPAVLRLEEPDGGAGGGGTLSQFYVRTPPSDRFLLLFALLKLRLIAGKTLVFTGSLDGCFRLKLFLERFSINAAVLNGELPANSRRHIVAQFNKGVFDILIATDEAVARSEEAAAAASAAPASTGPAALAAAGGEEEEDDDDGGRLRPSDPLDGDRDGAATAATSKSGRKRRRGRGAATLTTDAEFGVSRGVDFRGVTTVVNFDMPGDVTAYTHRIGRTARGGASGVALSFLPLEGAAPEQDALLVELCAPSPATSSGSGGSGGPAAAVAAGGGGPVPLPFDAREVEGFRYRVNDVLRSVNAAAIRAARLAEVRREVLASEALRGHFEDNPRDLAVLQQADKPLAPAAVRPHLKRVPGYLLPPALRAAVEAAGGGAGSGSGAGGKKAAKKQRKLQRQVAAVIGSSGGAAPAAGGDADGEGDGDGAPATAGRHPGSGGDRVGEALVQRAESEVYRARRNNVDPLKTFAYQAAASAAAAAVASGGSGSRRRGAGGPLKK